VVSKRTRQIAAAILTGKAETAVREDTGWHDAMLPRTDPECAKHVGKRPTENLTTVTLSLPESNMLNREQLLSLFPAEGGWET
jgi:hypothetical protein